ncbi:molybdate ABC transporter substrate-binding protein [Enterovibrio sp. ZSDZ35]|uniref:Molybdate ABC transporter substrate-binding protein n=1 Tax=Enterovibrio qingdaonensis TaxID=2899818 RepID=A0ABT5QEZ9_9GAMM|nr:molybdate ABC transporter substrate-binding protein [Enterovibrio sp. ZSDZ35]MDD1779567.1 molybdate ABC transporter substrate-binding protein [Enterovibrio sp. ZSDZ35]
MRRILRQFSSVCIFVIGLLCSNVAFANDNVLVFAASSMTTALNEIVEQYEAKTGEKITVSYGSSSALARQLAYGAPADMYISANEKWMDYAIEQGVIDASTRTDWVRNSLVLVANKHSQGEVTLTPPSILSAIGNSRLAISDPNHVPAGIYGKEALEYLNLWTQVENKLAFSNSVRATLALVERGEAPLGIVYYSDAIASSNVNLAATFPERSHVPIVFPKAMSVHAKPEADAFFRYLDSDVSLGIMKKNGFTVPAIAGGRD